MSLSDDQEPYLINYQSSRQHYRTEKTANHGTYNNYLEPRRSREQQGSDISYKSNHVNHGEAKTTQVYQQKELRSYHRVEKNKGNTISIQARERAIRFIQLYFRFKMYRVRKRLIRVRGLMKLTNNIADIKKRLAFMNMKFHYYFWLKRKAVAIAQIKAMVQRYRARKRMYSAYYGKIRGVILYGKKVLKKENLYEVNKLLRDYLLTGVEQVRGDYLLFSNGYKVNLHTYEFKAPPVVAPEHQLSQAKGGAKVNPQINTKNFNLAKGVPQVKRSAFNFDEKVIEYQLGYYINKVKNEAIAIYLSSQEKSRFTKRNNLPENKPAEVHKNLEIKSQKNEEIRDVYEPDKIVREPAKIEKILNVEKADDSHDKILVKASISMNDKFSHMSSAKRFTNLTLPNDEIIEDVSIIQPSLALIKKKLNEKRNASKVNLQDDYPKSQHNFYKKDNIVSENIEPVPIKRAVKPKSAKKELTSVSVIADEDKRDKESDKIISDSGNDNEKKFNYLKRKTKKMEVQKLDYKKVGSRINCWNTKNEKAEEPKNQMEAPFEKPNFQKKKSVKAIGNRPKTKTFKRASLEKPVYQTKKTDEEDTITISYIKNTYANNYLVKFNEIKEIPETEWFKNSKLGTFNFANYFDSYNEETEVLADDANMQYLINKAFKEYDMIMSD